MLPGYADEHVKSAIVDGLRRRGMDVVTVQEHGQTNTDDELILERAAAEGRLMVSNDTDFLRLHARWMATGKSHAGIVYWHQDALSIGEAIRRIVRYATQTPPQVAVNCVHYL